VRLTDKDAGRLQSGDCLPEHGIQKCRALARHDIPGYFMK
jgi:hypothetical protein